MNLEEMRARVEVIRRQVRSDPHWYTKPRQEQEALREEYATLVQKLKESKK